MNSCQRYRGLRTPSHESPSRRRSWGLSKRRGVSYSSHRYLPCDLRMRIIAVQDEVVILEVEDTNNVRIEMHSRQGLWITFQLQVNLLDMIVIDMNVSAVPDQFSRLQVRYLSDH